MKIFAFSDTHGMHNLLSIPEADLYICAGDVSNYKNPLINYKEMDSFIEWFQKLSGIKVYIPGNHDTAVASRLVVMKNIPDIITLEHDYITIKGVTIFGSPYTPTFHNWAYNASDEELEHYWKALSLSPIDILVTHGPPHGIMDIVDKGAPFIEHVGDKKLLSAISNLNKKPKYHIFGHIHNNECVINAGKEEINNITYMNVSCVTDGHFDKGLTSNGIFFDY